MAMAGWDLASWRAFRERELRSEWGFLTLVGLVWLEEGQNRIGSDPHSTIQIPKESINAGWIERKDNDFYLIPLPGTTFLIDGTPISTRTQLVPDSEGSPSVIGIGDYSLTVILRSGQFAVRLRDRNSPIRIEFPGISYFPDNPELQISARFTRYDKPVEFGVTTAISMEEQETFVGTLEFEFRGKQYAMEAQEKKIGDIFVTFRDATSSKTSYAACRFLLCPAPENGIVDLDFNRAYNPPCAFTPWATCSFPHPNNRLDFAIEAGERAP